MFSLDQHLLRAVEAAWIWIAGDSVSHCYLFLVSPLEGSDDMSTYSHPAEVYVSMFLSIEILYLYSAKCAPKEHSMILEWVYSKYINEAGIMIFLSPFLRETFCYSDDRKKGSFLFQMRIVLWFFFSLSMIVGQKKEKRKKKSFGQGWEPWSFLLKTPSCSEPPEVGRLGRAWGFPHSESLCFLGVCPPVPLSLYPSSVGSGENNLGAHMSWLSISKLRERVNERLLMQLFSLRPLLGFFFCWIVCFHEASRAKEFQKQLADR